MIIVLTGPFGVGKTTTARLLLPRIPGAMLYDPERLGTVVRALVRRFRPVPDYQDLRLWRIAAVWIAWLLARTTRRTLVIPLIVRRAAYYRELAPGFRRADPDLCCFQLTVAETDLRRRIAARDIGERGRAWCLPHLTTDLAMADAPASGVPVATDGRTPAHVADAIKALR